MLTSFLGPRLARLICVNIHIYTQGCVYIHVYVGTRAHTRTNTNTFIPRSQAMQVHSNENSNPMGFKSVVLGAQHFLPCQLGPTVSTWPHFALPLTVTTWYFWLLFGFDDASFFVDSLPHHFPTFTQGTLPRGTDVYCTKPVFSLCFALHLPSLLNLPHGFFRVPHVCK